MKHVPKYLMPRTGATTDTSGMGDSSNTQGSTGFIPFRKNASASRGRGRGRGGRFGGGSARGKKKVDPLKKFKR